MRESANKGSFPRFLAVFTVLLAVLCVSNSGFAKETSCPEGSFLVLRNGGECWSCPKGYDRTVDPIEGKKACLKPEHRTSVKPHKHKKAKMGICPPGFWLSLHDGHCYSCPHGTEHNPLRMANQKEACYKLHKAKHHKAKLVVAEACYKRYECGGLNKKACLIVQCNPVCKKGLHEGYGKCRSKKGWHSIVSLSSGEWNNFVTEGCVCFWALETDLKLQSRTITDVIKGQATVKKNKKKCFKYKKDWTVYRKAGKKPGKWMVSGNCSTKKDSTGHERYTADYGSLDMKP